MDLDRYILDARRAVDERLNLLLSPESERPPTIHRAMRYSTFAGGKRVRPILVMASGESLGGSEETLSYLGACIEMLHTYSLIHDDLPALDNDDLRRGRATCHKVFGDAMAILTGDALLTRAFQLLADLPLCNDATRLSIIRVLSRATGTVDGMIGGQVVDLESEGQQVTPETLDYIHSSKTGALLTACTHCAALASDATPSQLQALTEFGKHLGLAFQIVDDILDVTESSEKLGKTAGKDVKAKKATFPALYGIEASREKAAALVSSAVGCLEGFDERAEPLRAIARFVVSRSR